MTAPLTAIFALGLGAAGLTASLSVASAGPLHIPFDLFLSKYATRIEARYAMWDHAGAGR